MEDTIYTVQVGDFGFSDPLEIAPAAAKVEWAGYVDSWKGPAK